MSDEVKNGVKNGFVVSPWLVTLLISFVINLVGFAFAWGTVITRLDALILRVERLERIDDNWRERDRATRSPENYRSPPVGKEP